MASFEQAKYCPNCKKNVGCDSTFRCKICGTKTRKGSWSIRDRDIINPAKQFRKSGFKTEKEARLWYAQYLVDADKGKLSTRDTVKQKDITIKQAFDEYMKLSKTRVKETSLYDFESKCQCRILPTFGGKLARECTVQMVNDWQADLSNYSYRYRKTLKGLLSRIFRYIEKTYRIASPMPDTEQLRDLSPKTEMKIWSPDEFRRFVVEVDDLEFKVYFSFLYYSGCRKGEALALGFSDFDYETNTVKINKSITRKNKHKQWKITTPKNASSYRTVDMPQSFMDLLAEYRSMRSQEALQRPFVFGGDKPYADTTIIRKMAMAASRARVKMIRQHDFRHSHASYLISTGIPITMVSNRLGHANINETLKTYAHFLPQDKEKMISALNALFV